MNLILVLTLALGFAWATPTPALAANPAPIQIFYVTLPETDALTALDTINSDANSPVWTYFSIAIGVSGAYVYYDQWENGYDSDIANPTNLYSAGNPGGTQIWGNGESDDGCAPNIRGTAVTCTDANDVLNAGDVIIPYNSIPVPRGTALRFDARDKVGANKSISMARAVWASGSGTLNAFAHEMYATAEWGVAYEAPVGCDTNAGDMFEYSALSIMAAQNNTPIRVDADGNGTWDYTGNLNEGGSYLEAYRNRSFPECDYVQQGARVESTDSAKPIQVVLITGDIGSNYASRDMNLLPISAYGTSYWSPVGVDTTDSGPTRLWLYRPSTGGPTHITCERRDAANVTQAVSARGVVTVDLTNNQGARCYASNNGGGSTGEPIFAIGTVDSNETYWDWSFTLFPDNFLSTDALIGLGLGKDPTNAGSTENGSPLWVTAACTSGGTYVYVDWNNDGTADLVDLNGDGDTGDTVDGISETTSNNGMLVTRLYSVRLYNRIVDSPPYDQSGARVWSRTAANKPVRTDPTANPGCKLALAWGEDPRTASAASPGLDVGTSIPPLRLWEGTKSLVLKTDNDNNGMLSPGDVATYVITVKNSGSILIENVYVYDTVPANTTYFPGTTEKDVGSGWTPIPDEGSGTPFPLDNTQPPPPDGVLLGDLAAGATFYVRFDVTLGSGEYESLLNCDVASSDAGALSPCRSDLVATRDWGDLPDTYGTSAAADGPRHSWSSLKLGANWDRDMQGAPTAGADGDDALLAPDDEDGIALSPNANFGIANPQGAVYVTVAGGSGCLNAWMDFTDDAGTCVGPLTDPATCADGDFTKTGGYDVYASKSEHIIQNQLLAVGTTEVFFPAPAGLLSASQSNSYYFRFRLSPGPCTTAIAPAGFVAGGEVEDYLFTFSPLAVDLASFTAEASDTGVTLNWETVSETDNAGFNVYRADSGAGPWVLLNTALIPAAAPGSSEGHAYTWIDGAATPGATYWYALEDVALDGSATRHEPVEVTISEPTAVQLTGLGASPALGMAAPLAALGLALASGYALARRRRP